MSKEDVEKKIKEILSKDDRFKSAVVKVKYKNTNQKGTPKSKSF